MTWEREDIDPLIRHHEGSYRDFLDREDTPSTYIINEIYGGWNQALISVGREPDSFRGVDDEVLLDYLRRRIRQIGHPPSKGEYDADQKQPHPDSLVRRFGDDWSDVLAEVGWSEKAQYGWAFASLPPNADSSDWKRLVEDIDWLGREGWRRHWDTWGQVAYQFNLTAKDRYTKEDVREMARETAEALGRAPNRSEVMRRHDVSKSIFLDWDSHDDLLRELDLDPAEAKSGYSRQECIEAIQIVGEEVDGVPGQREYLDKAPEGSPSMRPIHTIFGSLEEARRAAGFPPQSCIDYSRENALEGIAQCAADLGESPSSKEYKAWRRDGRKNYPSIPSINRKLTSFTDLKRELGLDVSRAHVDQLSDEDYRETIEEVIAKTDGDGVPPAKEAYKVTGVSPSVITVIREYGGWNDALDYLGFEVRFPKDGTNGDYDDGGHYYGPNWYDQRSKVREREDECQVCGMTDEEHQEEKGCRLHVHHITPFRTFKPDPDYEKANALGNLVSLCYECHHELEKYAREDDRESQVELLGPGRWSKMVV